MYRQVDYLSALTILGEVSRQPTRRPRLGYASQVSQSFSSDSSGLITHIRSESLHLQLSAYRTARVDKTVLTYPGISSSLAYSRVSTGNQAVDEEEVTDVVRRRSSAERVQGAVDTVMPAGSVWCVHSQQLQDRAAAKRDRTVKSETKSSGMARCARRGSLTKGWEDKG